MRSLGGLRVFVTGHTGFKGSWLCKVLIDSGAEVFGFALEPPTEQNLFSLAGLGEVTDTRGDIRDYDALKRSMEESKPDIVIHMAAQPIVLDGYSNPRYTYETNVMGTVNVLEAVRKIEGVSSVVNVTTDKVYRNNEWEWGYRENDVLNGHDPYSNSKSCSELVSDSYRTSYFEGKGIPLSTARAGNVIGGGDFAPFRIIPDCVRSVTGGEPLKIRHPSSVRPYQHVLESLSAYLTIAKLQMENQEVAGSYNIGPDEADNVSTLELVKSFGRHWGPDFQWVVEKKSNLHKEANYLRLDCSKIKRSIGWSPSWSIDEAVQKVCEWTKVWKSGEDVSEEMSREIRSYFGA